MKKLIGVILVLISLVGIIGFLSYHIGMIEALKTLIAIAGISIVAASFILGITFLLDD
jgi:hypothetical protein